MFHIERFFVLRLRLQTGTLRGNQTQGKIATRGQQRDWRVSRL